MKLQNVDTNQDLPGISMGFFFGEFALEYAEEHIKSSPVLKIRIYKPGKVEIYKEVDTGGAS